jgi:N-dimethylarginine dimethylaminohydrolase
MSRGGPRLTAGLEVHSEYDLLEEVVMASPRHFRVVGPINATQELYFDSTPPSVELLVREQATFVEALESAGVGVTWAAEQPESPFQLNTRDVGVVVGDEFIAGRMRYPVREREPQALLDLLDDRGEEVVELSGGTFEGGDVLVDGETVYVGISQRTSEEGARHFTEYLAARGIRTIPVPLRPDVLHLDVVLNLAAPGVALAYLPALAAGVPDAIAEANEVIDVDEDEYARLATNVFAIGPGRVVADRRNPRVIELLRSRGVEVIQIDFEQTTKIGGSFRCMTLPLRRANTAASR